MHFRAQTDFCTRFDLRLLLQYTFLKYVETFAFAFRLTIFLQKPEKNFKKSSLMVKSEIRKSVIFNIIHVFSWNRLKKQV